MECIALIEEIKVAEWDSTLRHNKYNIRQQLRPMYFDILLVVKCNLVCLKKIKLLLILLITS